MTHSVEPGGQTPAPSKRRRLLVRLAAHLGLTSKLTLSRSETAALALRSLPVTPAPAQPHIAVLIPLAGKAHSSDWDATMTRLQRTLRSFQAQSYNNWSLRIACQDKPQLPEDPRIAHLPFTSLVDGNDKWAKLRALVADLPNHAQDGYVMSFDADDVLAAGTFAAMAQAHHQPGFLVIKGAVMDVGADRVAGAEPQSFRHPGQKALWKLCGSCAALRYSGQQVERDHLAAMLSHEHRLFPHLCALAGRPLTPFEDPTVLYLLNHGDNFGARRGRTGFKPRFVQKFQCTGPARTALLDRFPD